MRVLVVDDEESALGFLQQAIEREGHEVRTARDGAEGFRAFKKFQPDLVFTDVRMPRLDGLELLQKIRKTDPEAVVVVITGFGSEESAVEALRLHASNYLRKPLRISELNEILQKYDEMTAERAIDLEIPAMMCEHRLHIVLPNRKELVSRVVNYLVRVTGGTIGAQELLGVRLGLVEMLVNAIEHGNLGVTSAEKSVAMQEGPEAMDRLLAERLADPERAGRRVFIEFTQEPAWCEWIVRDEGDGFDWRTLQNPLDPEAMMNLHGRGIFLSRLQFDVFEYQGKGNVVRLRKNTPQVVEQAGSSTS